MKHLSLRWKLLLFFLAMAIIPTVVLIIYTARLVEETIDIGLNEGIESSLNDGRHLLDKLSEKEKETLINYLSLISGNTALISSVASANKRTIEKILEGIQRRYILSGIQVYDKHGVLLAAYPRQEKAFLLKATAKEAAVKRPPLLL